MSAHTPARPASAALAELLRRPRFEILPLDGIEEQVLEHLGTEVKLTVTASPRKGLEATLDLSERLARAGYPVVPHLSARLIRDRRGLARRRRRVGHALRPGIGGSSRSAPVAAGRPVAPSVGSSTP